MQRGEVWWVNFEPSVGGEIRKKRPGVISTLKFVGHLKGGDNVEDLG